MFAVWPACNGAQAAALLVFSCQTKQTRRSYHKPLVMHERRSVFSQNYSLLIPGFLFSLLLTAPLGRAVSSVTRLLGEYPESV